MDHSALAKSSSTSSGKNDLNFALWNIWSMSNKGSLVCDLLIDCKLHFLCLTETWQQSNNVSQLNISAPADYTYMCRGGIVIIYNKKWKISDLSLPDFILFETLALQINGATPTI